MKELKIRDYVRTKSGYISKYIGKNKTPNTYGKHLSFETTIRDVRFEEIDNDTMIWESEIEKGIEEIIKSSPNIIDVLEEHDFVQMQDRGNRFYEIERDYTGKLSLRDIGWNEYEELDETNIPEIVSIITHEQMEQMKYKVGVNNDKS